MQLDIWVSEFKLALEYQGIDFVSFSFSYETFRIFYRF